jgi:hypothetical protein
VDEVRLRLVQHAPEPRAHDRVVGVRDVPERALRGAHGRLPPGERPRPVQVGQRQPHHLDPADRVALLAAGRGQVRHGDAEAAPDEPFGEQPDGVLGAPSSWGWYRQFTRRSFTALRGAAGRTGPERPTVRAAAAATR